MARAKPSPLKDFKDHPFMAELRSRRGRSLLLRTVFGRQDPVSPKSTPRRGGTTSRLPAQGRFARASLIASPLHVQPIGTDNPAFAARYGGLAQLVAAPNRPFHEAPAHPVDSGIGSTAGIVRAQSVSGGPRFRTLPNQRLRCKFIGRLDQYLRRQAPHASDRLVFQLPFVHHSGNRRCSCAISRRGGRPCGQPLRQ